MIEDKDRIILSLEDREKLAIDCPVEAIGTIWSPEALRDHIRALQNKLRERGGGINKVYASGLEMLVPEKYRQELKGKELPKSIVRLW